ncbi:hypothetical protein ACWECC_23920 [Streptomyces microflavus]
MVCPRCRHESNVNRDGLCRSCLQAIRIEEDVEWVIAQDTAGPRDLQLLMVIYRAASTNALPLKKFTGGRRVQARWHRKLRDEAAPDRDDAAVLPPTVRGQLALFTLPRTMSIETVRRILQRPLEGYDRAVEETAAFAAEYAMSGPWQRKVVEMIRLALAVRDAEGHDLVPEEVLEELPSFWTAVGKILDRAQMLRPRDVPAPPRRRAVPKSGYTGTPPPPPPPSPRACLDCGAWMASVRKRRCKPCQDWRSKHPEPVGSCSRCRREGMPVRDGLCRGCCLHVSLSGPGAETEPFTQLWIADPIAVGLRIVRGQLGYEPVSQHPQRDRHLAERRLARTPLTPQLVMAGQQELFTLPRDWSPLLNIDRRIELLPELTPPAKALVSDLVRMMRGHQWELSHRTANVRALTILVSWLGADAPLLEADVYGLTSQDSNLSAKRLCQFLAARGMLVEDPERHQDPDEIWVEETLSTLPDQMADELRMWVKVLRGEGLWEHPARSFESIRRYLFALPPVIRFWAGQGISSLREVTAEDITEAIELRQGAPARTIHIALRSVFKALRQERLVFHDPARGVTFGSLQNLPQSVPSDILQGLLVHAVTALDRFIIGLVAVHALPGHEITQLRLNDLNLAAGKLVVRRSGRRRRTLHLEEFTHALAMAWLVERDQRWPGSINPYLLVSQQTASDPDHRPVSVSMLTRAFRPLGLTQQQVRQDRILDEARITADPLRLMRLFGISDTTAMRYVSAAHPERTAKLPR